jgi:hypothetical protein
MFRDLILSSLYVWERIKFIARALVHHSRQCLRHERQDHLERASALDDTDCKIQRNETLYRTL